MCCFLHMYFLLGSNGFVVFQEGNTNPISLYGQLTTTVSVLFPSFYWMLCLGLQTKAKKQPWCTMKNVRTRERPSPAPPFPLADPLRLPRWAHWGRRCFEAAHWLHACVPAELPGVVACTRSAEGRWEKRLLAPFHTRSKINDLVDTKEKEVYLCFGIYFCRMLEQEVNNLDVSIVAAYM